MHTSLYIAGRLTGNEKSSFSRPITIIAMAGVAIGLIVMIISMAIVSGFQTEITNKMVGFGSHIQIMKYDGNNSFEPTPISMNQSYYPGIDTIKGIRHIQMFGYRAGLVKSGEEIQGAVFKGIGNDYDWSFFDNWLQEGDILRLDDDETSNDVLISKSLARLLNLQLHDELRMFFLSEGEVQPRGRKFEVCGIYETGIEEMDNMFVIGDITHVRRLNNWKEDEVSGFEILIDDLKDLPSIAQFVDMNIPYDQSAVTIKETYPQIFEWLGLQDINAIVIIVLMLAVSSITMSSTLLIIIMENSSTIGILKALGGDNRFIREIFLTLTSKIVLWGMAIGNIAGIGLCLVQKYFKVIRLSQESYYMNEVPILLNPFHIILLNIGIFAACIAMIWVASLIIAKITPIKTIQS
ncbi:MAG: ABC transporter permease [Bacteroidales bacterium]|nr:ABC transporter permease [Bacteroidales bacterium]